MNYIYRCIYLYTYIYIFMYIYIISTTNNDMSEACSTAPVQLMDPEPENCHRDQTPRISATWSGCWLTYPYG
jgi:hypothetical protein